MTDERSTKRPDDGSGEDAGQETKTTVTVPFGTYAVTVTELGPHNYQIRLANELARSTLRLWATENEFNVQSGILSATAAAITSVFLSEQGREPDPNLGPILSSDEVLDQNADCWTVQVVNPDARGLLRRAAHKDGSSPASVLAQMTEAGLVLMAEVNRLPGPEGEVTH